MSAPLDWLPDSETPIAEAAIRYTEHGFAIIPLYGIDPDTGQCQCGKPHLKPDGTPDGSAGKHPIENGWQRHRPDVRRVRHQFLSQYPGANVGLVMGGPTRLITLDMDGPSAATNLAALERELGLLPPTLVSRSGRMDGGEHRLYQVPDGWNLEAIKNRKLEPKIDVRTTGGQIVVAPSLHYTKRRYAWTNHGPIAALPEAWYQRLIRGQETLTTETQRAGRSSIRYANAALVKACEAIRNATEGTRNETLNRDAYGIAGLVAAGELDASAYEALAKAARDAGLDDREIHATMRSAVASGEARPREKPSIDNRPEILVNTEEGRMVDQTITVLETRDDLYQRGGMLVRILAHAHDKVGIRFAKGTPRIAPLPASLLREMCSRSARYYSTRLDKKTGEQVERDEHPPGYTVEQVLARGIWPGIRPLTGVIEHPVLRPDGTVLQTPGYDATTGLLYAPSASFGEVQDRPTREDAQASAAFLLSLVAEFPFVQPTHKAGWLASILTLFARFSFEGCTPLFLVDAGAAGSGKSLLASLGSVIATGRDMPRMVPSEDEDEMRKRLLTLAIAGARTVLIDNVTGRLGGAAINMVLTSTEIEDRILGRNEMVTVPWTTVVYATANNARVADDTHRRTIYQRIEAETERPEDREGFAIPDLLAYAKERRTALVTAVLTVLRAYAVYRSEGGSPPRIRTMGSFEAWSAAVREPLVWIGQPDPYLATVEWRDQNDTSAQTTGALLRGWKELCSTVGKEALTAAKALEYLASNEAERDAWRRTPDRDRREPEPPLRWETLRGALEALAGGSRVPTSRALGEALRAAKGRVVDGQRLVSTGLEHKVALWKVEHIEGLARPQKGGWGVVGGHFGSHAVEKSERSVPLLGGNHGVAQGETDPPRPPNPPTDQLDTACRHSRVSPRLICSRHGVDYRPECGECGPAFNEDGTLADGLSKAGQQAGSQQW